MGEQCFGSKGRALVEQLMGGGTTLPTIAGILESKRPNGLSFLDLLSKELYRDFPFREITEESQRRELVQFVQDSNSTMRSVAALCAKRVSDVEFVSNEMVRAVVNLNCRLSSPYLCSCTVWLLPLPYDRERVQDR
jgi:hypothetical protein